MPKMTDRERLADLEARQRKMVLEVEKARRTLRGKYAAIVPELPVEQLTVTTTPKAWPRNHELASATRHVRAALGLHPQLVAERAHEIGLWEELLPRTRYVGEVGLDAGPRFYRSFETQKEIFARVLTLCAAAGNKIVTTHSVRATKAVLDMIEQYTRRHIQG